MLNTGTPQLKLYSKKNILIDIHNALLFLMKLIVRESELE